MNFSNDQDSSMQDLNVDNAQNGPGDTVSSIAWAPNTSVRYFTVGAWDSKLRLYEVQTQMNKYLQIKTTINLDDTPLSMAWTGDCTKVFCGLANNYVTLVDLAKGASQNVGVHEAGVKDVYYIDRAGIVISLSFDKTMKIWDCRQQQPVGSFNLGYKVFCSDMYDTNLVLGLSEEKILMVDLNNLPALNKPEYIESPLGLSSQLTCIGFFSNGEGLGVGSFDGRANLSTFSKDNYSGRVKLNNVMTFKCHKIEQNNSNQQTLFPVHGIGFHPKSRYFVYTAGGEGNMFYWDYNAKSKIKTFQFKGTPVTKVKMSPDGMLMAYALGYDWSKGLEGIGSYKPRICCHILQENELIYRP